MQVRRFHFTDFDEIKKWGEQWGAKYEFHQFPRTGFIVPGVAAFFLYKSDSSVCWLENMVSNKHADDQEKEQAIRLIVDAILQEANDQGFSVAYATTGISEVIVRAVGNGATAQSNQTLLTKKLTTHPK